MNSALSPRPTRRLASLLALAVAFAAAVAVTTAAPASAARPQVTIPPDGFLASISAPDPSGDVAEAGDLTPLLGPEDVYAATDLTGVKAGMGATTYSLLATTAGVFTGESDLPAPFPASSVSYGVSWRTVSRTGVVSDFPNQITLTVSAEGTRVTGDSLPPRCRNGGTTPKGLSHDPYSVAVVEQPDGTGLLNITVPRLCTRPSTGSIPWGVADLRVRALAQAPGGAVGGSYQDAAEVLGVARIQPRR